MRSRYQGNRLPSPEQPLEHLGFFASRQRRQEPSDFLNRFHGNCLLIQLSPKTEKTQFTNSCGLVEGLQFTASKFIVRPVWLVARCWFRWTAIKVLPELQCLKKSTPTSYLRDLGIFRTSFWPPIHAECAGINRQGVANERVVQDGVANHPDPESCVCPRKPSVASTPHSGVD